MKNIRNERNMYSCLLDVAYASTYIFYQCRSKGNISEVVREEARARRGVWGMLPQKILKSKGLEMLFPAFSKGICDLRISQIIYFVHCLRKPMHIESMTLETSITK